MYIMKSLDKYETEANYSERKKLKINKTIDKIDAIIGKSIIAFLTVCIEAERNRAYIESLKEDVAGKPYVHSALTNAVIDNFIRLLNHINRNQK